MGGNKGVTLNDTNLTKMNFEIVVGTYEEFLLGYKLQNDEKGRPSFVQTFASHDHTGSIRTVSAGRRFIASGGSDDRVFIYDLVSRTEHTVLSDHSGSVSAVSFAPNSTHLLTGSEDGTLLCTRVGNWQVEKKWGKAHGGQAVNAISVHPSGKLALTLGNDNTLRTWNLVKGRLAYILKLTPNLCGARLVQWSPNERTFALCANNFVEIWDIQKGGCKFKLQCDSNVASLCWIDESNLVVGLENGTINVLDEKLKVKIVNNLHSSRVKCLVTLENHVVSCDSSGRIILWRFLSEKLKKLAEISCDCRVTCAVIFRHVDSNVKSEDEETEASQSVAIKQKKMKKSKVKVTHETETSNGNNSNDTSDSDDGNSSDVEDSSSNSSIAKVQVKSSKKNKSSAIESAMVKKRKRLSSDANNVIKNNKSKNLKTRKKQRKDRTGFVVEDTGADGSMLSPKKLSFRK